MENKKEFIASLIAVARMYNRPDPTQDVISLWVTIMDSKSITGMQAANAIIQHSGNPDNKFPPMPGDIVSAIYGNSATRKLEAAEAWALVDNTIRKAGRYRDVVFEDAAIHTAIAMLGGWVTICGCESDEELRFIGKDFVNVYAIARQKTGHAKILLGSQPGAREPYLAGDHSKCLAVIGQIESNTDRAKLTINAKHIGVQ